MAPNQSRSNAQNSKLLLKDAILRILLIILNPDSGRITVEPYPIFPYCTSLIRRLLRPVIMSYSRGLDLISMLAPGCLDHRRCLMAAAITWPAHCSKLRRAIRSSLSSHLMVLFLLGSIPGYSICSCRHTLFFVMVYRTPETHCVPLVSSSGVWPSKNPALRKFESAFAGMIGFNEVKEENVPVHDFPCVQC